MELSGKGVTLLVSRLEALIECEATITSRTIDISLIVFVCLDTFARLNTGCKDEVLKELCIKSFDLFNFDIIFLIIF